MFVAVSRLLLAASYLSTTFLLVAALARLSRYPSILSVKTGVLTLVKTTCFQLEDFLFYPTGWRTAELVLTNWAELGLARRLRSQVSWALRKDLFHSDHDFVFLARSSHLLALVTMYLEARMDLMEMSTMVSSVTGRLTRKDLRWEFSTVLMNLGTTTVST